MIRKESNSAVTSFCFSFNFWNKAMWKQSISHSFGSVKKSLLTIKAYITFLSEYTDQTKKEEKIKQWQQTSLQDNGQQKSYSDCEMQPVRCNTCGSSICTQYLLFYMPSHNICRTRSSPSCCRLRQVHSC
jgi:hypothetical protein